MTTENTAVTAAASSNASSNTNHKGATTMSNLAAKQAYVAGFKTGAIATATVANVIDAGLVVNLSENAPTTALCLGLNEAERKAVADKLSNGQVVTFEVTVVEANPEAIDSRGNIRTRLVTRITADEAAKLASVSLSNLKTGDAFVGKGDRLVKNDNGKTIGIIIRSDRNRGFLHANQVDGGSLALESMMAAGLPIKTTILYIDQASGKVQLTTKPASFVASLNRLSGMVGQTVSANIVSDRIYKGRVKVLVLGTIPAEVELAGVKLADGQAKIKVAVNDVNLVFGSTDVSIVASTGDGRGRLVSAARKANIRLRSQEVRNAMKGSGSGNSKGKGGKNN